MDTFTKLFGSLVSFAPLNEPPAPEPGLRLFSRTQAPRQMQVRSPTFHFTGPGRLRSIWSAKAG